MHRRCSCCKGLGDTDYEGLICESCEKSFPLLKAKAEAWDKVAFLYPFADGRVLCSEFDDQIERLKKLEYVPETEDEG